MSTVLKAKSRTNGPRSILTEHRKQGYIPAVVYGFKAENTPVFVSAADFIKTIREVGRNGVISLQLDDKQQNVVLNEYQEDPLRNEIIHVDFLAVDLSQEIQANVRVELSEDSVGVKNGGVLQQILHELTVTAKPDQIPDAIQVDVSALEIGDTVSVGEIRSKHSVTINHEDDDIIASILAPRTADETEEAEPEAANEGGAEE
ncbi:MAG TPA: 50S ribosomal protein L25/general stress protein Ctc [Bacillaceae bacterium]